MINNIFMGGGKYSTEEQVIGELIDGKPIYRKVFQINYNSSSKGTDIPINISNIDTVINMFGYNQNNVEVLPLPYSHPSNNYSILLDLRGFDSSPYFKIASNETQNFGKITIIFEYTKTTDTVS